ncbi:MAG: hypothetical protein NTZ53_00735 [Cyanobacteria bacterium]|nr:hypothetical protein [Cyanobacteriota bacterium]
MAAIHWLARGPADAAPGVGQSLRLREGSQIRENRKRAPQAKQDCKAVDRVSAGNPGDCVFNSRAKGTGRNGEQIKEGLALSLLALLQIAISGLFLQDANGFVANSGNPLIISIDAFMQALLRPLALLFTISFPLFWLALLLGKRVPRWLFDAVGSWYSLRLMIEFILLNALLFTPAVSPRLLVGQIMVFIPCFVLTWGWMIWRIDFLGRQRPQQIVALPGELEPITSFDYYHTSVISIVNNGSSKFKGITRTGRAFVLIHSLMLLDLLGLIIARLYALVQKMI